MGRFAGLTKAQVIKAIKKSSGIVSTIASRLGCSWHTAESLIAKWPETKEAYKEEQEVVLDMAEGQVIQSIASGDMSTTKWYLAKKGRRRGYDDLRPIDDDSPEDDGIIKIVIDT